MSPWGVLASSILMVVKEPVKWSEQKRKSKSVIFSNPSEQSVSG